ncbi:MAG: MarR family transcriptional regulator [Sneathiella sp.]|nr:MarR family transcriptional regulator [Sneathiella sp.]MDF2368642.1 MarR family transcriptional regulator [Sneathiella sp.]
MYSVLSALQQSGAVDQTTLAKAVAIDKTNMTDILDRLKRRGLIKRRVSSSDRRVRLTSLTEEGRNILNTLDEKAHRAHERTIESLSPEDRPRLIEMMTQIINANTSNVDEKIPSNASADSSAASISRSSLATQQSYKKLIAVEPALTRIEKLEDLIPDLPSRTLLHAGPPFSDLGNLPRPMRNSLVAAAQLEGWTTSEDDAFTKLKSGKIHLRPAQDFGVVTPLAFIVGPSAYCLEVEDIAAPGHRRFSPLNDGPLPYALRLGNGHPDGLALLHRLSEHIGAVLAKMLTAPIPLLPILDHGLRNGDDLHGQVAATQAQFRSLFPDPSDPETTAYLASAGQFSLNIIMATAALMIGAGADVAESNMVIACGGNGQDVGYKLASNPSSWVTRPALPPVGVKFEGQEMAEALPAIGDSAVIDVLGFGAACLRTTPSLAEGYRGHIHPDFFSPAAHAPFIGPHPALSDSSIMVGLDLTRPRTCLGINLGMVERTGTTGLIGRGVAPWPEG